MMTVSRPLVLPPAAIATLVHGKQGREEGEAPTLLPMGLCCLVYVVVSVSKSWRLAFLIMICLAERVTSRGMPAGTVLFLLVNEVRRPFFRRLFIPKAQ